ncbi:tripartite tricarboxylate transporter permease [Cellulomonas sp. NPDC089187]|uniref:tripartite tricarboxylate transporter permease n=1 Tax=Cellulomonas sp. NPDC089187 TaxID=3154970 RepID=UPI00344A014C
MELTALAPMVLAALAAVVLYTLIGFVPGTDETSVLLPVTLTLVLAGVDPQVVLAFFIAAVVTLNLTNSIPTALVGLPGGVLSAPMIDHALTLKREGLAAQTIRKMAAGSVIGTLVSVPLALLIAGALAPFAEDLRQHGSLLFVIGAVVLALIGKNRFVSLLSIVPLILLFQGVQALYRQVGVIEPDATITVSFFLSITAGPLLVSLFEVLNPTLRAAMPRFGRTPVRISREELKGQSLSPRKLLTRAELGTSAAVSAVSTPLFFLSPVALTLLLGEAAGARAKDPGQRSSRAITAMAALAHSTYLAGLIIPLLAIGLPLSPVAVGPANALFNAPPVFTPDHNIHHILSTPQFIVAVVVGGAIALVLSYVLAVRYSFRLTAIVTRRVPHEAVLALFLVFVLLLAYLDAGWINVFAVLLVGLTCGTLNRMGVSYGVQFMSLYAGPWLITQLM